MTSLESLNLAAKPLEIFGFQYFSIKSTQNSSKLSKFRIFFFIFRIFSYTFTTIKLWLNVSELHDELNVQENILVKLLNIFQIFVNVLETAVAIVEPFVKVKSERKFYELSREFQEILSFNFKRKIYFKKLSKTFIRRLIFVTATMTIFIFYFDLKVTLELYGSYLTSIYYFLIYLIDVNASQLILYKFCFYVDLITLHLKALLEAFDEKSSKVKDILSLKKLYVLVLEMTREFNYFMSVTAQFYILTGFIWIFFSIYRIIQIKLGVVDESLIGKKILKL